MDGGLELMPSLPTPGGDFDTWGTLLNEFLQICLNDDGTLSTSQLQIAITAATPILLAALDLGDQTAAMKRSNDSNGNPQIVFYTLGTSPTSVTLDSNGFRPSTLGSPPLPLGTPTNPWSSLTVNSLTKLPNGPDGSAIVTVNQMNAAIAAATTGGSTAPGAPTSLGATPSSNSVALSWTAPSNTGGSAITGYTVFRGTTSGGETQLHVGGTGTSFTDSTAVNGTTYFYYVVAVNAVGSSAASNEVNATPLASNTVPGAPTLTSAVASPGQVVLNWTLNANNGGASVTSQQVLRSTSSGTETLLHTISDGTTLTYTDSTAVNGTTYFYEIESTNSVGASNPSNELSATPTASSMSAPTGFTTSELEFEENFLSGTLDSTKWTVGLGTPNLWQNNGNLPNPYSGENQPGGSTVSCYHPNQVSISGGICTLKAQLSSGSFVPTNIQNQGYTWVCGALTTLTKFQISTIQAEIEWYIQVRTQFPDTSAGGWPAIWFLPSDGSQELDMIEGGWLPNQTGNNWPANTQIHRDLFAPPGSEQQNIFRPLAGGDYTAGYHIYGMHVQPGVNPTGIITWFVDGTQVDQQTGVAFSAKAYTMMLTFQIAAPSISGWHTTGGTTTLNWLVDEIQIYAK